MDSIAVTRTRFPTEASIYTTSDGVRLRLGDSIYKLTSDAAIEIADRLVDNAESWLAKEEVDVRRKAEPVCGD